mmetsp:Transcript_100113/g.298795  ORF Transcript_100113/g.298795 Transcript_100113/m.298795 type:complete len:244 (-) Transcript_100113:846-1577(-)
MRHQNITTSSTVVQGTMGWPSNLAPNVNGTRERRPQSQADPNITNRPSRGSAGVALSHRGSGGTGPPSALLRTKQRSQAKSVESSARSREQQPPTQHTAPSSSPGGLSWTSRTSGRDQINAMGNSHRRCRMAKPRRLPQLLSSPKGISTIRCIEKNLQTERQSWVLLLPLHARHSPICASGPAISTLERRQVLPELSKHKRSWTSSPPSSGTLPQRERRQPPPEVPACTHSQWRTLEEIWRQV